MVRLPMKRLVPCVSLLTAVCVCFGMKGQGPKPAVPMLARIDAHAHVFNADPAFYQMLNRLDMRIRYREHSLDLRLTHDSLTVRSRDGVAGPISLCVGDEVHELASGSTRVFPVAGKASR